MHRNCSANEGLSSVGRGLDRLGFFCLLPAMGLWLQAQSHAVTIRVQMPDPAMEAVVEVEGQIHAMEAGLWGAWQATLELDGDFAYRFGTPAGPLGLAWENAPGN